VCVARRLGDSSPVAFESSWRSLSCLTDYVNLPALIELRCLASGEGYHFTSWRNVFILDFYRTPTVEALDATTTAKRLALQATPGGLIVLNLVDGTQPVPSAPIRAYAEERSKKDLSGVLCHATIVFGDGFRVATMRSVLSGIIVVQNSPFPRRVFSSVGEAVAWTAKFAGAGPGYVQGLVAAVRQAQAREQKL
jgi:hypothetical protein